MAAVLVALGYCIYTTTMDKRHAKKEQQAELQRNMRSDSEKPTNPSAQRARDPKGESLRAKAVRKLHGKDANPTMLGDPVSVKAETSAHVPTDNDAGSQTTTLRGSESGSERRLDGGGIGGGMNPTMLGDPVSVTAEMEERSSAEERDMEEASRGRRGSKL